MRKFSLHPISSFLAVSLLAAHLVLPAMAKPGKVSAPKLATRTGVLVACQEGQCMVDVGKSGQMQFTLSPETRILSLVASSLADIQVDSLVQVQGEGQANHVRADALLILPNDETWRPLAHPKAGNAYPATWKKTSLKAKVTATNPLIVLNHEQKKVDVELQPSTQVQQWVKVDAASLVAGKKLEIRFRRDGQEQKAFQILILGDEKEKKM